MSDVKGFLTTHVLDTANGCPASAIPVALYKITNTGRDLIVKTITNIDGRCDQPILAGDEFAVGRYELVFKVDDYFNQFTAEVQKIPFLDEVTLRFAVDDENDHYHIPLLVSPYSYSTYRGS